MPVNPPDSTLTAIENKVRRLTRAPTIAQLSEADLEQYINTFVVYDMPEQLRQFSLHRPFTFYANPYQDRYESSTVAINPLFNFKNIILTINEPIYIGGFQSFFSQSREQFYGMYPKVNNIASIGPAGDGDTKGFTGNVNTNLIGTPGNGYVLLQNEVLFSSVATDNSGLALVDVPVMDPVSGNPTSNGNLYIPGQQPALPPVAITPDNTINYVTGVYTITFPVAPAEGQAINSQTVPQVCTIPQALLYFDDTFVLRPIPDQPYRINFEAYVRPTYIMELGDSPQLEEWWQYIAYGAAKKIFEDRMDLESVQLIMPEFKKQEALCLRRTIVQYTNERTSTIYTEQTGVTSGGWGWGSGSNL